MKLAEIRRAVADYIGSEGCSCCENRDEHAAARERLGKLLRVELYSDKSGRDFGKYETKRKATMTKPRPLTYDDDVEMDFDDQD